MTDAPSRPAFKPLDLLLSKWTALLAVLLLIGGIALQQWLPNQRLRWAIQALDADGAKVFVDYEEFGPEWLRVLAGHEALQVFAEPEFVSIQAATTHFGDEGMMHLTGLKQLVRLDLRNTQVSDEGLKHLVGLTELEDLDLSNTQVSDEGLKHLAGLTELHYLDLSNTRVSDEGLKHLAGLTSLVSLWLSNTQVSDEGMARLCRALPRRWIIWD
jgi:hypothetical protein